LTVLQALAIHEAATSNAKNVRSTRRKTRGARSLSVVGVVFGLTRADFAQKPDSEFRLQRSRRINSSQLGTQNLKPET
jgi:hypothetical protein